MPFSSWEELTETIFTIVIFALQNSFCYGCNFSLQSRHGRSWVKQKSMRPNWIDELGVANFFIGVPYSLLMNFLNCISIHGQGLYVRVYGLLIC